MRYLNEQAIKDSTTYADITEAVEEALYYYHTQNYNMPERFHYTHNDKTLMYMPCFSKGVLGTKLLTIFPENLKVGLPSIDGLMMLNDYDTGKPKAMMDGQFLTALRTGAVGSLGAKYLASPNTSKLGLIGAGAQGIYQVIFATGLLPITDIYITSRTLDKLDAYVSILKEHLKHVQFHILETAEEVVKKASLIITATSSMTPVLPDKDNLYKGKTFIAIGSYQPSMRELPDALIKAADEIYVDIDYAKEESGDLNIPLNKGLIEEDKIFTIAELIHSEKVLDAPTSTLVYKSVGMALFDVIVANKILEKAVEKNIGQVIQL
jgi:ornithine cyclodeaminase